MADKPGDPDCRYFLTAEVDPAGNTTEYAYNVLEDDAGVQLTSITDALGQATTFSYELTSDPLKITKATDPFGRAALFTYTPDGRLASSTDSIGTVSQYGYDAHGGYLSRLTTPYGTTKFQVTESPGNRILVVTNTQGAAEIVQYCEKNPLVPAQAPSGEVPSVVSAHNTGLNLNNSYYWTRQAVVKAQAAGIAPGTASFFDYAIATHYLVSGNDVTTVAASIKNPLENRVWLVYPNQDTPNCLSADTGTQPSLVARKLPGGADQISQATYNAQGNVTESIDPMGRSIVRTYADNGIDLLATGVRDGSTIHSLSTMGDYVNHRPGYFTGANGETTVVTYNTFGSPLTVTNALGHVTEYTYDSDGHLLSVKVPGGYTTTFTYDDAGRVETSTNSDNYELAYEYDDLDRPTKTTFPDASYEQTTYQHLLPFTTRDRMGRETHYAYDSEMRLITKTNPAGHSVQYGYCICGAFNSLKDENGSETKWENDAQGRRTAKVYADNSRISYGYDSAGRLTTVTDARGQVTTTTYNIDNTVAQRAWSNLASGVAATHSLTLGYSAIDGKVTSMIDGIGETSYSYYSYNGHLGAGRLKEVSGPVALGTYAITYEYDELNRMTKRTIGGAASTFTYDSQDRPSGEVNSLGSFTYSYDGNTSRPAGIAYPNGMAASYIFDDAEHDLNLKQIKHADSSGSVLEQQDYTYNVVGQITNWRQQPGAAGAYEWRMGYDATDKLLAVDQVDASTKAPQKRWDYFYDPAGNRVGDTLTNSSAGSVSPNAATYNSLSQLTTLTPGSGFLSVEGATNKPATVTVNSLSTTSGIGNRFSVKIPVQTGASTTLALSATGPGTPTATKTYTVANAGTPPSASTYDTNGNLISDGRDTYEWDALNQLVAINYTGASPAQRSEFTYDGLQRRVKTVERVNGIVVNEDWYVWNGLEIVQKVGSSQDVEMEFFRFGSKQNLTVPNDKSFYSLDHLGSVRGAFDAAASPEGRYIYDPYGQRSTTAGAFDPIFSYGHYLNHQPSGLLNTLFRAYLPETGRWLSRDPLLEKGGVNLYRYANDNPINYTDALGLAVWIEGPSPGQAQGAPPGEAAGPEVPFHRSICVGDPNGAYESYSYGTIGGGRGAVYYDTNPGGEIVPDSYLDTTPKQDKDFNWIFSKQIPNPGIPGSGSEGMYDILFFNCRTWSQIAFDFARKSSGINPSTPPARTPKK